MRHPSLLAVVLAAAVTASAQEGWPRQVTTDAGVVTLYQPQVDDLEGNRIEGRAALSWRADAEAAPVFGAAFFRARFETDRDERLVTVTEIEIPELRFPDSTDENRRRLTELLESEIAGWELQFPLDALVTDLEATAPAAEGLRHDPPRILIAQQPTVLVRIDGEPRFGPIEGADGLEQVINTPFPIIRQVSDGRIYLSGGRVWYVASDVMGPWEPTRQVPVPVLALVPAEEEEQQPEPVESPEAGPPAPAADAPPPAIRVVTGPAELVVMEGEPRWSLVEGAPDLLYLDNSDADAFLDIESQSYFVLLSGRWYRAPAIEGGPFDWEWVANDALPAAFSDIAEDSVNGHVLAHVAGTPRAREAALDASVPQTAAIRRDAGDVDVEYDGAPKFEAVAAPAEPVSYAVNTPQSVFRVGERYFLCEDGVWYEAAAPTGPWKVATDVPEAIYGIPASNPHHNVTYVHVYDVTPEVVYVGYTPGYTHTYVSHGCVVYGTGWPYPPYWGPSIYYPRHWTWGVSVRYHPWYGWGFGIGWSNGPFSISIGFGGGYRPPYYGWWGPWGYRPYPRYYPYPGYRKPPRPMPYSNRAAARPGVRPRPGDMTRPNLYQRPANRGRLADRSASPGRTRPGAAQLPNDVLTDRQGNVYRRGGDGSWQRREGGGWRNADGLDRSRPTGPPAPGARPRPESRPEGPAVRPSRPSGSSRSATRPQLERDWQSRQRGAQRSREFRSRPAPSRGGARPARRRRD